MVQSSAFYASSTEKDVIREIKEVLLETVREQEFAITMNAYTEVTR